MDGVKFLPSFLREIYPPRTIRASRFLYSNISVTKYTNEKTSSGCLFLEYLYAFAATRHRNVLDVCCHRDGEKLVTVYPWGCGCLLEQPLATCLAVVSWVNVAECLRVTDDSSSAQWWLADQWPAAFPQQLKQAQDQHISVMLRLCLISGLCNSWHDITSVRYNFHCKGNITSSQQFEYFCDVSFSERVVWFNDLTYHTGYIQFGFGRGYGCNLWLLNS